MNSIILSLQSLGCKHTASSTCTYLQHKFVEGTNVQSN